MEISNTTLTWKRGFLSNTYYLKSDGKNVGELNNNFLSNSSNAIFKDKHYKFKTKGFFNQSTDIIDLKNNKIIGEINYNSWGNKAKISIDGKVYRFKADNFWYTRWSVYDYEHTFIEYSNSYTSGKIQSNINNEVLILSGLSAINYYWQILFFFIIMIVVIL